MSAAHYVFAGGGTGGHLFPGLSVAHALRSQTPAARITFFTTQRKLDRDLLRDTDYEQRVQPVRPATRNPLKLPAFLLAWRRSVSAAIRQFRGDRPNAVLGLGGYAAGPPVVAAHALRIPTAILNPDAIPGRANRFLARRADVVGVQWGVSRAHFPRSISCRTWGCPIREAFLEPIYKAKARQRLKLDKKRPLLLVTGASQGAHTINEAMQYVWPEFQREHSDWQLLHLTGAADEAEVRKAYDAAGAPAEVRAFTNEMALAMRAADLVVSRAGASTLAELTALGKPSILLPYPYHRDQHQLANALVLAKRGAALLIEDECDAERTGPMLLSAMHMLRLNLVRDRIAAEAAKLGVPDAAQRVARWMLEA